MAPTAAWLAALFSVLTLVPLATAAARSLTPDQKLVAGIQSASAASRAALQELKPPRDRPLTPDRIDRARADLNQALAQLKLASQSAPQAVGALETPSLREGLRIATTATISAAKGVKKRAFAQSRLAIEDALEAEATALKDFGVPLKKDFGSFAVFRDLSNIYGLEERPMSVNAKVGAAVKKIVIGTADRTTANAEEGGSARSGEPSIAITALTIYSLQDPTGGFMSGWCELEKGIIVCKLDPQMKENELFAVAFGPRMPAGTKLLVKFWSTTGKRSFALLKTR